MTDEQFSLLMDYIDQAIDAKLEALEEGPDGYRGFSNSEAKRRNELRERLRAAFQPKDAAHKDWCPVNGTEEANTLGACTCGASGNEPNSGTNLPKSSEVE